MSDNPIEKFERTLKNSGVKLKNVPNTEFNREERQFSFADYVAKNVGSWGMVPANPDDVDVEEVAEDSMYDIYETMFRGAPEVTMTREEDDMYWAMVVVDVPEDEQRQRELGELVGEALFQRMHT